MCAASVCMCVCIGVRAHACVDICVYVCTRVCMCVIRSALVSMGQYEVFDSSVKCVRITNHTLGFFGVQLSIANYKHDVGLQITRTFSGSRTDSAIQQELLGKHLGSFYLLTIVNNVAINMSVQTSLEALVFNSSG